MLPEFGGIEVLAIAALALIVVGPKDLPVLLRKVGKFVGRMRGMANEFRASFDEMARQSELDELRKEVEAMRLAQSYDPTGLVPGAYGAPSSYDGGAYDASAPEEKTFMPVSHAADPTPEPSVAAPKRTRAAKAKPAKVAPKPATKAKAKAKPAPAKPVPAKTRTAAKPRTAAKSKAPAERGR